MIGAVCGSGSRYRIVAVIVLLAILLGLAGCTGESGDGSAEDERHARHARQAGPTASPTETATPVFAEILPENRPLRVLLVEHPTSNVLKKYVGEFEALNETEVELEITSYYEAHQKQLIDFGSGSSEYDVMMVIDTWLPEFAISDNILELKRQIRKMEQAGDYQWMADIVPNVNVLLGQWQGKQVAVPLMASSLVLMYRKDLFEDPEQQAAFLEFAGRELTVPETWEEFNEVASFFTRTSNPDSPVEYGISVAASENSALCLFQTVLWGVGGREFAKRWRVTLNNEEGVRAMGLWAEQAQYSPPDAPSMYWYGMNQIFAEGQAAMQIQWDAFAEGLETSPDSRVRGHVGYALVPGEPEPAPVIAGWVLVINRDSDLIPMAWEFVKWCCGPDLGYTLNREGGQLPRISLYTAPDLVEKYPYYETALLSFEIAQQRTSFTPGGPTLPAQAQYEEIVGGAAHDAFTGQESPLQAVNDAAEELGMMLEQIGWR